jgi:hypothetical protein
VTPAKDVEVESSDSHDGVVGVFLVWDQDCTGFVPDESKVVVGWFDIAELGWACSEKGSVLNIGIVFWWIGDEVMNVVRRLPPSDTQTTAEVGDKDSNHCIRNEFPSDSSVTSIVGGKHDLLPETSEKEGRGKVPFFVEGEEEESKDGRVSGEFSYIVHVVALVVSFGLDFLMESVVPGSDGALGVGVGWWVFGETLLDFRIHCVLNVIVSGFGGGIGKGRGWSA